MRLKTALFLLTVWVSFTTNAWADPDPDFPIFLCFGQSNMEGYPGIEEQDKTGVDDRFQTTAATAAPWMKNIIKQYNENPYQTLVDMGKLAQKEGVIKGILLHQGESNTGDKEWPTKVKRIYDHLIKDLNLKAEDVPLLAGELVHADQQGACASMNSIIAQLPETIPNAHVVSSAGCTSRERLHFNPAGYRELGKRYAEQMLSILGYAIPDPVALTVHTDQTTKTISTGIYGQFLEHIFHSVHGGLWGDQILNGTLELSPLRRSRRSAPRGPSTVPRAATPRNWEIVGDANDVTMDRDNPFNAEVSLRIAPRINDDSTTGSGIRFPDGQIILCYTTQTSVSSGAECPVSGKLTINMKGKHDD